MTDDTARIDDALERVLFSRPGAEGRLRQAMIEDVATDDLLAIVADIFGGGGQFRLGDESHVGFGRGDGAPFVSIFGPEPKTPDWRAEGEDLADAIEMFLRERWPDLDDSQEQRRTFTRKVTAAKRAELTERLLELHGEQRQTEDAKKAAAADYKARLERIASELGEIVGTLRRGTYTEQREVVDRPDYEAGEMVTVDADTGEELERRALTADERQMGFEPRSYRFDQADQTPTRTEAPDTP